VPPRHDVGHQRPGISASTYRSKREIALLLRDTARHRETSRDPRYRSPATIEIARRNSESAGNYLRVRLPLTVEANNQGGTLEITIPAGNPDLEELLKACSGSGASLVRKKTTAPR
jgi:hypothetical protein